MEILEMDHNNKIVKFFISLKNVLDGSFLFVELLPDTCKVNFDFFKCN